MYSHGELSDTKYVAGSWECCRPSTIQRYFPHFI